LVKNAQGSKPNVQKLVDRISQVFVPIILVLAVITFVVWFFFDRNIALISLINILIIACPCALGLATPISLVVSVGKGANSGILVKDAQALEISNQIKAIIFDKTGTLTVGQPEVQEFKIFNHKQPSFIWNLVKTAETLSAHPLAKALVNYATKNIEQESAITLQNFVSHAGAGIEAKYKKETLLIGTEALLIKNKIKLDEKMQELAKKWRQKAYSLVFVALGGQVLNIIAIADKERANSLATIQRLQAMGIKTIMLTGDNKQSAQNIAKKLQIDEVIAEVLPAQKEAVIKEMKAKYGVVAMVGDGINDAPALSSADVGIAMGNGTDVAIEAAGITLLHSDIALVPQAIHLSQLTFQNIRQNLFWAFAYNIVLIPVAMGVFYPQFNLLLNPMLAGLAMAFSSVTVVANALRLKGQKL
jgi:heavy metal translocating P-type ATPase